jgi:endoglucanase
MDSRKIFSFVVLTMAALSVASARADIQFAGVNLAGADFGVVGGALPGVYNSQYTYPTQPEVDYFKSRGMNIIRLPFRWERLQHTNNVGLDATELSRLDGFVSQATAKGMYVILDPHNFERYYPDISSFNTMQSGTVGLIGSAVPDSWFTDFWSRVATIYKTNDHVFFNLMNEPNSVTMTQLVNTENAVIAAIRATGASNLILVPGSRFTGAWTWSNSDGFGQANAQAMLGIVDPTNNFAFDAHQYLDSNGSGGTTNIVRPTIGMERLTNFTAWLKINNLKGFLGEFAVGNSTIGASIGDEALTNMLSYIRTNSDVWTGWTWWAGGPWWGNYIFALDPVNLSSPTDQPAMTVLRSFFPLPTPSLVTANGTQFQFPTWPGFRYQPEISTDLTSGTWTSYGSEIAGNGLTNSVNINFGSDVGEFYRVRVRLGP